MAQFVKKYLSPRQEEAPVIFDLDSQDSNGTYRSPFDRKPWRYRGMDLEARKNVDNVLRDPHRSREIKAGRADVVVCGQTFEQTVGWRRRIEQCSIR